MLVKSNFNNLHWNVDVLSQVFFKSTLNTRVELVSRDDEMIELI